MKLILKLSKRRRIVLFYIIGLILPGILLGLFALRGLRNDQALQEKQNQQELKLLSIEIFSRLDQRINEIRQGLLDQPQQSDSGIWISWNKKTDGQIAILQSQMLYWPDGSLDPQPSQEAPIEIEQIQKTEFSHKNYSSAINQYQTLLEKSITSEIQVQALIALARLYKKTDQAAEAVASYQNLIENHPGELLPGGLPVKAIALLEIVRLSASLDDSNTNKTASADLIQFLLNPPVPLEKTSFYFLLEQSQNLGVQLSEAIQNELEDKVKLTNYLQTLDQMSPGLLTRGMNVSYIESHEYPSLLLLGDGEKGTVFAWILAANQLINQELGNIFTALNPVGDYEYEIKINGNTSTNTLDQENLTEVAFPSAYPPWSLRLSKKDLSAWDQLFKTSQGVLLLVFVFIFLLMIAGLIFMLYTLNQEMRVSKMKSQFISNVSHEFKTPLTSIRHMTEIMHLKRIDSEERKEEYLQSMLEQCDHLGHLIENILDFSKIEEDIKNYRFEEHRIDEIVQDLIPVFKGRIGNDRWEINLDVQGVSPPMLLDKDAIQQVLFNLLDNAYKYSGNSSRIDLVLKDLRPGTKDLNQTEELRLMREVCLIIRDYGIGIGEKDLGRIFERFYRGDRLRTEGIKGSGIGLTIVNRIVRAHGGRIEVQSEVDKGTIFSVYLPVNQNVS